MPLFSDKKTGGSSLNVEATGLLQSSDLDSADSLLCLELNGPFVETWMKLEGVG